MRFITKPLALIALSSSVLLGLTGCSNFVNNSNDGYESGSESVSDPVESTPASEDANPEIVPQESFENVSATDLELASSSIAPHTAVEGRYIIVQGYEYFDTLTALKLDSGDTVYFATSGGAPFGSTSSGLSIAANQETRVLTGFGELVPADGPAGLDAVKFFNEHGSSLY